MAPGAGLVAVQVFTRPSGGAIPEGTEASVLAGLNHVAGLAGSHRIAAVNLSVTVGEPTSTHCDAQSPALKSAVDALRARRVVVVGASGNDFATNGITAPSCLSNVVSVGSVDLPGSGLPEQVSAFSNSAPILDLLAPGSEITSAYPGGAATLSGTSMAAPHVAGAAAVFASRRPSASSATIARLLRESGVPVSDPLRGTFPRLDALGLLRSIGDGVGVVDPTSVALRNTLTAGSPTATLTLGAVGRVLVGDWDGNGTDTLGYRSGNTFQLTNRTDGQGPFVTFAYGNHLDAPISGDWDGDGIDTVAIRRGNSYYLRNSHAGGGADLTYAYGTHTDTPVTGDWDGNGTDTPGVRRGNSYFLRNAHAGGAADHAFSYGTYGDTPVTGDWDGNGTDTPGIRRDGAYYLRLSNTSGPAHIVFGYGDAAAVPIVGNWDGT
jgi:subtilisin family serine protease